VNYKIEGFFELCKSRGLTGTQGVIIPHQNCRNLMLKPKVVEAVANGTFHIYAAKNVEEAIEILTGVPAAAIFHRVSEKLDSFAVKTEKRRARSKK
jgi:predicted ATP-dependent protease